MSEVVSDGTTALAVGSDTWASTDGLHWTAMGGTPLWTGVVAASAGFIRTGGCGTDPVVCTSADGRTWESHPLPLDWQPEAASVASLAVGHGIVVAVGGSSTGGGSMESSSLRPYRAKREAWWSTNGSDWHLGSITGSGTSGPDGPILVTDTGFVAYNPSDGFWRSADGRTWSRVAHSQDPVGTFVDEEGARGTFGVDAITFFHGHYIAAGARAVIEAGGVRASPGIFVSNDLVTWRRLGSKALAATQFGQFVTAAGTLYAIEQGSTETGRAASAWRSRDGVAWTKLPLDPAGLELEGLAVLKGRIILAAMDLPGSDPMSGPSNGSVLVSRDLLPTPSGS